MMSFRIKRSLQVFSALALVATLLTACYDYDDEKVIERDISDKYINLTIAVNVGNEQTRAEKPEGDEDGDGREVGFVRENEVKNITVLLYESTTGLSDASATIAFKAYYPTVATSRKTQGGNDEYEVEYTTGDKKLDEGAIDVTKTYHALIIANKDLTAGVTVGTTTVGDVLNLVESSIFTGSGKAVDAKDFLMTSERDAILNFPLVKEEGYNAEYYRFSSTPLVIERMAARIDFWTKYGATVNYVAKTSATYDVDGYEYPVYKDDSEDTPTSTDIFKLAAVIPFNINNSNEYLFKRLSDYANFAARSSETPLYLDVEDGSKWVLDAYSTAAKTSGTAHPAHHNSDYSLTNVQTLATDDTKWLTMGAVQSDAYPLSSYDNFIVGYVKENTVDNNSPLYYHATGLALLGYYFKNGDKNVEPTKFVYYGYLRHQGENTTGKYSAVEATALDKTATISSLLGPAMNYGVVRNNIYRISIDRITEKGTMELSIKVKMWDPYMHALIYM